ncbi:hypothetical protein S83_070625 [Arachis hypogaea]
MIFITYAGIAVKILNKYEDIDRSRKVLYCLVPSPPYKKCQLLNLSSGSVEEYWRAQRLTRQVTSDIFMRKTGNGSENRRPDLDPTEIRKQQRVFKSNRGITGVGKGWGPSGLCMGTSTSGRKADSGTLVNQPTPTYSTQPGSSSETGDNVIPPSPGEGPSHQGSVVRNERNRQCDFALYGSSWTIAPICWIRQGETIGLKDVVSTSPSGIGQWLWVYRFGEIDEHLTQPCQPQAFE